MKWHGTAAAGQTGGNHFFWLPRGVRVGAGIHDLEEDSALETTIVRHGQRFLLNQEAEPGLSVNNRWGGFWDGLSPASRNFPISVSPFPPSSFARHVALGVPAFSGAIIGHVERQFTLPLGVQVEIDADAGTIAMHESAVA